MNENGQRACWLDAMLQIAMPVLSALSQGKLRKTMPAGGVGRGLYYNRQLISLHRCFCGSWSAGGGSLLERGG